jgi:phospholipid/cholesterol/gamma-HCH transport system ATP-binding protein
MTAAISLRRVEKAFGENRVLCGIDLDIEDGTTTALIGQSGGGKSVLLKCAAGLLRTDAGSISILGNNDVDDWEQLRANIGMLFQRNALFDSMNVWQNVAFALQRRGMALAEAQAEAFRLLAMVGLDQRAGNAAPGALSGGMRKRAALARAIAGSPKLLLLDDPTAGLDPVLAASMEQLIRHLVRQQGATALVVTADVHNLHERFDSVALLDDGQIVWHGASDQVSAVDHALLAAA